MFVSFVIAIFLTLVNLQNCPNDYDQSRNKSFVDIENSKNLQKNFASELDRTLVFATKYLDNLYFEKFGKKSVNTCVIISTKKMSQLQENFKLIALCMF